MATWPRDQYTGPGGGRYTGPGGGLYTGPRGGACTGPGGGLYTGPVIGFGSDAEVRKAFEPHNITKFDLHPIDSMRLEFDTAELGLLNEALARAISRERGLRAIPTRHGWKLYVDPQMTLGAHFEALRKAAGGALTGVIDGTHIGWSDAVMVKIERRLNRNWFVFEPGIWLDGTPPDESLDVQDGTADLDDDWAIAREFVRERAAKRYNHILGKLIDGWLDVFVGVGNNAATLRTNRGRPEVCPMS